MATKPKPNAVYQLKVTLVWSDPPIWRRFVVPGSIKLADLHDVLQIVMGWENDHMYQFIQKLPKGQRPPVDADPFGFGGKRSRRERYFLPTEPYGMDEARGEDDSTFALCEVMTRPRQKLMYQYDFGDGWMHELLVEKIRDKEAGEQVPRCLGGERACPPEDSGGMIGYYNMLEALADPADVDHDHYREWAGDFDAEAFDLDRVNKALRPRRRGRR